MPEPNNPYSPPRSKPGEAVPKRQVAPPVAILLGVLTDIGGSILASFVLTVIAAMLAGEAARDSELLRAQLESGPWESVSMILGCLCTVLGGYVTARTAGRSEYLLAAACGLASMIIGELLGAGSDGRYDFGMHLVGWIVTIPLALLGARWRLREIHRGEAPPAAGPP